MKLDTFTGVLFKGGLKAPAAKFLVGALRRSRELGVTRFINPCAGEFGLAQAAVSAGFDPSKIITGDTGLVSAIIGTSIAGRPLADLGIRYLDERLAPAAAFAGTKIEAGAALAAIKACQYKTESQYTRLLLEDITSDWERAASALQEQIDARVTALDGCTFEIEDMWAQIKQGIDDPHAAICLFPPAYRKGYDRMFPVEGRIAWSEPKVPQFDPALQPKLYDMLRDGAALAVWAFYGELPEDGADRAIFSEWAPNRKVPHYWLANRPEGLPKGVHTRRETKLGPSEFPLWPNARAVTADTVVRFVETSKSCALYYRDLFAHKLGVTRAERYFLVLLDGHLMSVFGVFFDQVERGVSEIVHETFGFTVPNAVHARLSRLFMMLLVSGDARAYFRSMVRNPLRSVSSLQTTCIAPHPEVKTDRGILKLRERTKMPDGRFKLVYAAPFPDRSFADRVAEWLNKDGKVAPRAREEFDGGVHSGGRAEPGDLEGSSRGTPRAGRERARHAAGNAGAAG